jgi:hypothetical protein
VKLDKVVAVIAIGNPESIYAVGTETAELLTKGGIWISGRVLSSVGIVEL